MPRSLTITKVTASVQVQYSGVGDLNVYLYSPFGTRVRLLERNCGSLVNIDTTFDDAAAQRYSDFCPSEAGRGPFRGNEPLANANNENSLGYWRLAVENNGSSRTGLLTGFSITVTGTTAGNPAFTADSIASAAGFKSQAVSPGEVLGIFGFNLGPTEGVRAPSGAPLPTTLGGSSVTFDGVAAPMLYASSGFVAVQAPTTLTAGGSTNIQARIASGSSGTVSMPIAATSPGILTYEVGSTGQAKAINQDGTLNGDGTIDPSHRAAARGSVIQVYATGLGAVTPAVAQGVPAPSSPLSTTVAPVTATIGSAAATVSYAGAAPGLIGTYQVNIAVPMTAPRNAAIVLFAGGNASQPGVTIATQ
jgi:uncharacterized protein (TIGR03437 family)